MPNPLAQIVSEDQDNSLLGNVSRWLGRPGYAVRSLLRGEFGDAGENLLQMGLDLPTFGLLNRDLSLGNLFSETGDITTKRERPEFSDLVGYRGQGGSRVGLDIAGGMLTDPLTYLTFGGSGIAKGALAGMGRGAAASTAGAALRQTAPGAARLAGTTDDVLKALRGPLGAAFKSGKLSKVDDLLTATDDVLAEALPGIGSSAARREAAAKAARGIEARAVEKLLGTKLGKARAGDAIDNGIKALVDDGSLLAHDALRLDIPFTQINTPLVRDVWGKIGGMTAPGLGLKALRVANAPAADLVEAAGKSAWNWTKTTFYDRIGQAGIQAGLQHVVRKAGLKNAGDLKRAAIRTRNVFEGLGDEGIESLGRLMTRAEDDYLELVEAGKSGTEAFAEVQDRLVRQAREGWKTYHSNPNGTFSHTTANKALGPAGERAIKGYMEAMGEIPEDLVKLGLWKKGEKNPFYVPHQIQPLLMELLGDPLAKKNEQLIRGIKSVFDGKRKIRTAQEFAAYVTEGMDMAGQNVPEILKELADFGDDAMNYNLRDLMFKRLSAHANTVKRSTIWEEGKRLGMEQVAGDGGDAMIRTYVDGQIKGAGAPENAIYKLMAGGKIKLPIGSEQAERLRKAGAKISLRDGEQVAEFSLKGVNHYVKPLLTSFPTNPAFHIRNWIGAAFMSTLDPDLGWPAFSELVGSFPGMAWAGSMGKAGKSRKLTAMVIEAANGSQEAMEALAKSNARFGKYTALEAVEAVQNGVGKVSQADLASNLTDDLAELMGKAASEDRGKAGRLYDAMVKVGEKAANHTEEGMRTSSILRLMEKGVDPTEAIRRTNRAFVDYASQSVAESWARQFLPFAKFAIGSTAWLGEFARRPRLLGPITHGRNAAAAQLGPDEVLPERVADSFALPMGKDAAGNMRYMTSLGLPHESALNMLSAASSAQGFRKNILGAIHPFAKLPLEAATNRDFFFGDEHGSYTKAPNMLPKFLTTETKLPDGRSRYEVPGFYRELWDAMPTSRMTKTLDRFMDDKRALWDATLQSVTGTRIQSVDQKRELRQAIERYLKAKVDQGQVVEFSSWIAKGDPADAPEDLKVVLAGLRDLRKKKKQ